MKTHCSFPHHLAIFLRLLALLAALSIAAPSAKAANAAVLMAGNYPGPPAFDDTLSPSMFALAANLATWPNWTRGPGGNIVELPGNTTPAQFLAAIDPYLAGGPKELDKGDFFLLFYFGHGGFYSTDETLAPANERLPALNIWEEGPSFPNGSAFSDNKLTEKFRQFKPGVIKAFVNISCFSGGLWNGNNPLGRGDLEQVPNTILMASSIEALPTLTGNLGPRPWEPHYLRRLIFNLARNGRRSLTRAQWHALSFVPGTVTGFRLDDPNDAASYAMQLSADQEEVLTSSGPVEEMDSTLAGNSFKLSINYTQAANSVTVSWPSEYIGAMLQRTFNLNPPITWVDLPATLTTNRFTVAVGGARRCDDVLQLRSGLAEAVVRDGCESPHDEPSIRRAGEPHRRARRIEPYDFVHVRAGLQPDDHSHGPERTAHDLRL